MTKFMTETLHMSRCILKTYFKRYCSGIVYIRWGFTAKKALHNIKNKTALKARDAAFHHDIKCLKSWLSLLVDMALY